MGEVWKAQDLVLQREIAVKFLRFEHAESAGHIARFEREARTMSLLQHPGIVRGIDFRQDEGLNYMVMEFVPGTTLSALIKTEGRLDVDRTLSLITQTAQALAAAHGSGLVHRDVKPSNILITPTGMVKVADFGIAFSASDSRLTVTGQVIGTAQYISPEQASGRTATAASDIYALGAIGYECLTGRPPFSGPSQIAVAIAHIKDTPPPLPAELPQEVRQLIMSMLSKDPAKRPSSAAAVARIAEELRKKAALTSTSGTPVSPTTPLEKPRPRPHSDKVIKLTTPFAEEPKPSRTMAVVSKIARPVTRARGGASSKRLEIMDATAVVTTALIMLTLTILLAFGLYP
ncbi:protein kinase [Glutamicibacter arilaitensis]|uniref:serine/threonine-protein kinase n=1 Tax=Glutamicibacter arilaitensis TaxID=256701 RepID=UPI003850405B